MLSSSESSITLFRKINEIPGWMHVQLCRVFKRYVSPQISVEMLKVKNIEITGYPTEKNPAVLARIINASSNPGDLILDSFSGSGTTLAVASQLGHSWIGSDNSLEAMKTTLKRFTEGRERMGDFVHGRVTKSKKRQDV